MLCPPGGLPPEPPAPAGVLAPPLGRLALPQALTDHG